MSKNIKRNTLFIILFGYLITSCGQKEQQPNFEIDGTINVDSGKVCLYFYSDYIPNEEKVIFAEVKDKKFSISGYIPESQAVFIDLDNDTIKGSIYVSSEFIIDKGLQTISIDINLSREVPVVKNKTMLEEYPNYLVFYEEINTRYDLFYKKIDSLNKLYNYDLPNSVSLMTDQEKKILENASDRTLLRYTEKNPNSKLAFWKLISLMGWGYEPIFDSIYNTFSDNIRNGYAGQVLKRKLQGGKQLTVGKTFPDFNCQNTNGENLLTDIFLKNKFTLVDFWYSNCGPCRRQFSQLRNLYKQYGGRGFEIVAISVDQMKNKEDWENLIVDENLIWKQYWDKNGAESHRFSINVFPTNFLIDSTGKIIDKNISLDKLDVLLRSQVFKNHSK